jgi:hypothetical protein
MSNTENLIRTEGGKIQSLYSRGEVTRADRKVLALAKATGRFAYFTEGACSGMIGGGIRLPDEFHGTSWEGRSYRLPDGTWRSWGREPQV